jgi:hypothetical protein
MKNPKYDSCIIRVHEWVKGIETIMSKKRDKGAGEEMAEEFINYMQREFMGGI